jgi:hypothetical protein
VKDFMIRNVKFIWYGMTYSELKSTLKDNRSLSSFPLSENPESMILLGSIHRQHLIKVSLILAIKDSFGDFVLYSLVF